MTIRTRASRRVIESDSEDDNVVPDTSHQFFASSSLSYDNVVTSKTSPSDSELSSPPSSPELEGSIVPPPAPVLNPTTSIFRQSLHVDLPRPATEHTRFSNEIDIAEDPRVLPAPTPEPFPSPTGSPNSYDITSIFTTEDDVISGHNTSAQPSSIREDRIDFEHQRCESGHLVEIGGRYVHNKAGLSSVPSEIPFTLTSNDPSFLPAFDIDRRTSNFDLSIATETDSDHKNFPFEPAHPTAASDNTSANGSPSFHFKHDESELERLIRSVEVIIQNWETSTNITTPTSGRLSTIYSPSESVKVSAYRSLKP